MCHQVSFGELQLTLISLNFKTSTCNQKSDVWEQNCVWLFNILILKAVMTLKSKSWCILLNKNIKFNTNGTKSKTENPTHSFRGTNLVLQLVKESQIKSKTVLSWRLWKKKKGIFCTNNFVRRDFFKIYVLSQCLVYWIHFQNIHIFTYQKTSYTLYQITSYTFVACF